MRTSALRTGAAIAAAALATTLTASPAAAADPVRNPDTGLVFYGDPLSVVARQAAPDGRCHPFPADADWLLGWSGFQSVTAYRTADCTDQPYQLGIFRGFQPGFFTSYRAA